MKCENCGLKSHLPYFFVNDLNTEKTLCVDCLWERAEENAIKEIQEKRGSNEFK